jgi:hypothetical protein
MKKYLVRVGFALTLAALLVFSGLASGQAQVQTRSPIQVAPGYLEGLGAKLKYARTNKMTPDGKAAVAQQRIRSVPTWSGAFTFQGTVFPFTMVGRDPTKGGTADVDTSLIPISFFFDEFVDQNGNNIVIDINPVIPSFLNSPNFEQASYTSGFTQFADAVQRAEFFNIKEEEWHTLIEKPHMLTPVQVEVPVGSSQVFQTSGGVIFALIDFGFFISQLNTIVQLEPLQVDTLAMALTRNALFYDGNPNNCCTLGFHTAFETAVQGNVHSVQTFAQASWLDQGIFRNPTIADAITISHEISEWINDPFVNNLVPPWEFPDNSGCQNDLETGDPVEVLPNPTFPVTIRGVTYHPQTEALLPWFSRQTPNRLSLGGAFSYPDTTALTSPSKPCTP